jgi:hypothetical protein
LEVIARAANSDFSGAIEWPSACSAVYKRKVVAAERLGWESRHCRRTMHLIQLLLPLYDNNNHKFSNAHFNRVRQELTDRFGGVTAFVRSPAVGLWKERNDEVNRDEVIMFEVMAEQLDKEWWAAYRIKLQEQFRQDEVLIWASAIMKL